MIPPRAFTAGSTEPPRAPGALRIYSMRFCPFAHRALLVLIAKKIPHEVVNINLSNKPEWYVKKFPPGKVPLLETEGVLLPESMIVAEYLEEAYPGRKLLPQEPYAKAQDKVFLESFSFISLFKVFQEDARAEGFAGFWKSAEVVEKELQKRGTKFLGGTESGFVDLMIWPFFQITTAVTKMFPDLRLPRESHPLTTQWMNDMFETREVKTLVDNEHMIEYLKSRIAGSVQYDAGL